MVYKVVHRERECPPFTVVCANETKDKNGMHKLTSHNRLRHNGPSFATCYVTFFPCFETYRDKEEFNEVGMRYTFIHTGFVNVLRGKGPVEIVS